MNKRVIDLTDSELELLAGKAWSGAAQEALANNLSITGSRDGRRYRYHSDGQIEDLGPVASNQTRQSATKFKPPTGGQSGSSGSDSVLGNFEIPKIEMPKFEMTTFEMPKFEMPTVEMPTAFREFVEHGLIQTRDTYERIKAASEEATGVLEATYSTATKGALEYGLKIIEATLANTNAAFDYAIELTSAKTLSEVIELSNAHARKQFETLMQQSKELSALTQKVADEVREPIASRPIESSLPVVHHRKIAG
jgi:phasin